MRFYSGGRGTILLTVAAAPLLVANAMYLAAVTSQAVGNDIGGGVLMLFSTAMLLTTPLVFVIAMPFTHPVDAGHLHDKHLHAPA